MDTSLLRIRRTKLGNYASHLFPVLVALTAGPVMLHATNPVLSFYAASSGGSALTSPFAVPCVTNTGAPTTIYVGSSLATSETFTLVSSQPAILAVLPSGTQTIASTTTRIPFTLTPAAGCDGYAAASGITLTITPQGASAFTTSPVGPMAVTNSTSGTTGLVPSATTFNFTCVKIGSTYYPSGAQTLSVTSTFASLGTPFTVSAFSGNWLNALTASAGTAPASGAPATIAISVIGAQNANACSGVTTSGTTSATGTFTLVSTGTAVAPVTITVVVTAVAASASPLVLSPNAVTIYCSKVGAVYTPSYPQTVTITSPVNGGTIFSVDPNSLPTGAFPAAWLNVTPQTAQTASATPATLSVGAAAGCDGLVGAATATASVSLLNPPNSPKTMNVTLALLAGTPLTAAPVAPSLTYVKGSGVAGFVDVNLTSNIPATLANPFFSVNTATLPAWLKLDSASGTAPQAIRFSSTGVADNMAPGTYTQTVVIGVAGYGDLDLQVSMLLTNAAPQLAIQPPPAADACTPASPTTFCIPWTIGQPFPTPTITAISTDSPISYKATTGGLLNPQIPTAEQNGLAYSFGTPISVSFSPQAFASAQPGNILTGTMTLTWGNPVSTTVVSFNVEVQSPGATISSFSPAALPVAPLSGSYTITVTGTGFSPSTKFGVVPPGGGAMNFDTNIQYSSGYINQSNYVLTITVQNSDPYIPFSGANPFGWSGAAENGVFTIGVCNPVAGAPCTTATGSKTISIGTNPIISAVTSSSALIESNSVSVAPFDMVSLFGQNFCIGCSSTQVVSGAPDPVLMTYPTSLTLNGTALSVTFQPHTGSAFVAANAPLLFATTSQINLLVPSAISGAIGSGTVDVVVHYGAASSAPFNVTAVAQDPGIFTVGADGQGSGAALDLNYNLISATNPAGLRTLETVNTVANTNVSDTISIYMTGLGVPDSTGDNTTAAVDNSGNGLVYANDCVTLASYLGAVNTSPSFAFATGNAPATLDGAVILPSALNTGRLQPCVKPIDITSVDVGGVAGTVTYAGWVADTVAGLYQINVQLPKLQAAAFTTQAGLTSQSILQPTQVPVVVTMSHGQSQSGVSLWVTPSLYVTGPSSGTINSVPNSPNTVAATVGVPMAAPLHNTISALGGTGNITYAVTSGLLPQGLSLDPGPIATDANAGLISGTPAAGTEGTYTVTVTATDSAATPVTGTVTFVVQVGNGLFVTETTPSTSLVFENATPNATEAVTTVTATGGAFPYFYTNPPAVTSGNGTALTGLSVAGNGTVGNVATTGATPAGTYQIVVSAQDSATPTPVTGTASFPITVHLQVAETDSGAVSIGAATTAAYNTITSHGNTGAVTYTMSAATALFVAQNSTWLSFANGIFTVTSANATIGTYPVTVNALDGTAPSNASAAGTGTVTFNIIVGA